jgi:ribonuclease-3
VKLGRDFKSQLQELFSACGACSPEYKLLEESGPPHDRLYHFQVLLEGRPVGQGQGKSKKLAQQAAAAQALENVRIVEGRIG